MKISPSIFEAFLKCPTKSWLRFTGEPTSGNEYAEWVQTENESYHAEAARQMMANAPTNETVSPSCSSRREEAHYSAENLKTAKWRLAFDVPIETDFRNNRGHEAQTTPPDNSQSLLTSTATIVETHLHAIERIPSAGRGKAAQFIPIRFIYRNKLTKNDKLLLAYDAFVLSQLINRPVTLGKIIHGDDHSTLKVKTSALAGDVRKLLDRIVELLANPAPPDLVLNRHCGECEFQARCRKIAVEKDDLSLLATMSAKERQKLRSKGIFTVTQLSYTFRPRRRPKKLRDKRERYHHALKALAIREQKTHIVGSPELKIEGTPVYLDVEGLPDRDFYYLIGLRIGNGDSAVQHSLWADTVADEGRIWRESLAILETVEKPVLLHYGSYETNFMKQMEDRHGSPRAESVAANAITSAINLVSFIFARIYFPTFSNGLKEVAGWFGYRWSENNPAGTIAITLRHDWELLRAGSRKQRLIDYNRDDCAALESLANPLTHLAWKSGTCLNADFVDIPKTPATERGKELQRCLNSVLKSAHWIHKHKKISLRTIENSKPNVVVEKLPRRSPPAQSLPSRGGRTIRVARKRKCPWHPDHATSLKKSKREVKHALMDLAFTKNGCKKTLVRYVGHGAYCPHCKTTHSPRAIQELRSQVFGSGFHVWAVYLRVALRLSVRLVAQATRDLFHVDIPFQSHLRFVEQASTAYRQTEETLLRAILNSEMIHIDETKMNIQGVQQFVWVMTDGLHVVFRLTPTREAGFLHELLSNYEGTVISDFYAGYDSLPCRQQKCWVHLIRDLNDDLWKHPFDAEYEQFVSAVRDLISFWPETVVFVSSVKR